MKKTALALVLAVGAATAAPSLSKPVFLWEWTTLAAARQIIARGVPALEPGAPPYLVHPPCMAYLVAASLRAFGDRPRAARLPGLGLMLLCGALLFSLGRRLGLGENAASLAAALYLTNPFAIQGFLCIDFTDGGLLPAALLACALAFLAARGPRRALAVGLCLAACFWAKLTTPLILVFALFLVTHLAGAEAEPALFYGVAALGAALFAVTWAFYCARLNSSLGGSFPVRWLMLEPLRYLTGGGAAKAAWQVPPGDVASTLLRFALYAGPLLFVAAAPEIWRRARRALAQRRLAADDLAALLALGVLSAYSLFLGGGASYPKYFQPALGLLALSAAGFLEVPERKPKTLAVFAVLVLYYAFVVGDNNLRVSFGLRRALLEGAAPAAVRALALGIGLYLLPLFFTRTRVALAVLLLASQLGVSLRQGFSDYDLRYAYGTPLSDLRQVVRLLKEVPSGPVVADPAILRLSGAAAPEGFSNAADWNDLARIEKIIKGKRPAAVVYGVAVNTIGQLRELRSEPFRAFMAPRYRLTKLDSFWVWRRL